MYKSGELTIHKAGDYLYPDSRGDDPMADVPIGTAYLPHSCDEWIIGGREQVEMLIADLQAILEDAA